VILLTEHQNTLILPTSSRKVLSIYTPIALAFGEIHQRKAEGPGRFSVGKNTPGEQKRGEACLWLSQFFVLSTGAGLSALAQRG
jgi:hypothetical protein